MVTSSPTAVRWPKMKPLVFPTHSTSVAPSVFDKNTDGPKPLVFPSTQAQAAKKEPVQVVARKLSFPPVSSPPATVVPQAAFNNNTSPQVRAVIAELKKSHAVLYAAEGNKLEREVEQLVPLDISRVMSWASTYLTALTEISSSTAHLVRSFSEARGAELIDETVRALTHKQSFLSKMMGDPVAAPKPRLMALRAQLQNWVPSSAASAEQIEKVRTKLTTKMISLRVVSDMCGNPSDAALSDALYERQMLLAQATTQSQLVAQQLIDVRRQIIDQLARIEQLVNVTIPAYETANASR